jgi:hypothetical protein
MINLTQKFKEDKWGFTVRVLIFLMFASFIANLILIFFNADSNFFGLLFGYLAALLVIMKLVEREDIAIETAAVFVFLFFIIQVLAFGFNLNELKVFVETKEFALSFGGIIIPVACATVFELIYRNKYYTYNDEVEAVEDEEKVEVDRDTGSIETKF